MSHNLVICVYTCMYTCMYMYMYVHVYMHGVCVCCVISHTFPCIHMMYMYIQCIYIVNVHVYTHYDIII